MNIVIMAGGGGSRLWPLSRHDRPKQFLDLGSGLTLLEHTYNRLRTVAANEDIFIATLSDYQDRCRELLPDIPAANYCLEVARRDTAPAFAAAAAHLVAAGRGEEPTLFVASDHIFTKEDSFMSDVKQAMELISAHPQTIITLGHIPTFAETGYGYIETGDSLPGHNNVFEVKSFKEKPDADTAAEFVAAGNYYWNMANFGFMPNYLLSELRKYEPELMAGIDAYQQAITKGDQAKAKDIYSDLPKLAIDYAVMERTPRIIVVTGDYGWSDIGSWRAVHEIFGIEGDHMPRGHHVHVDSEGNYIYNATDKLVSLIGVKDTIAVVTDDVVLITDRHSAQKVKDVVQTLEKDGKNQYL